MALEQKKRSEIDNAYKWDLTTIYSIDSDWYKDLEELSKNIEDIKKFKGILVESAYNLYDYLELDSNLERRLYKLYYYAHLNHDSDTTNTTYQTMKGKIDNLATLYSSYTSYVNPELMSVDYDLIKKFYQDEPKLKEYEIVLEDLYRYKPHVLSEAEENILSVLSNSLSNPSETYESLTDADMTFGKIHDEFGNLVLLTDSNYSTFMRSNNRNTRIEAFNMMYDTYASDKNTISSTFKGNVDVLTSLAKIKRYNSSLESSLFSDNIDPKVYHNLIDTVTNNLNVIYKYYNLKKKSLNLDELHLYDIYTPLVSDLDKEYDFNNGKKIVLDSLKVLGSDYVDTLNKAFDEKWIDIYNNVGKRGGAYSSGFYDTNPFILLNYENKIHDVLTLGHELGHSMHTYYSCKNNSYQNSHYEIFVAEVASTVNELLIIKSLLKNSNDKKEKMYLLNELMELFKGTIYRQVMFAEFEMLEHKKHEDGEILTYEALCDDYYKLNKKYFGSNVVIDDKIKYEWERIPHFYYDFYVYKYAIGLSCACYIVDGILNNKENALDNYKKFLSLGGSMYPSDELKVAGIDIDSSDVIESAIKMFDETIDEFEKLYNS